MKKKLMTIIAVVLILTSAVFALAACDNGGEVEEKGTMTLVIATETPAVYTVDLEKVEGNQGLISVLAYLYEAEGLTYAAEWSAYGGFLTKVGQLSQDAAAGVYLYIYTSVEADYDLSAYAATVTYGGKTLTSSGVGASQMTVTDGCTVYIGTVEFGS